MEMSLWYAIGVALCCTQVLVPTVGPKGISAIVKPQWSYLPAGKSYQYPFNNRWILAAHLIFKKTITDKEARLSQLTLRWRGPRIDHLVASLYTAVPSKKFLPIEDQLVCDGTWNPKRQTLLMPFEEEQSLGALNIYYLVLSVPPAMEHILRMGSFIIEALTGPAEHPKNLALPCVLSFKHVPFGKPVNC